MIASPGTRRMLLLLRDLPSASNVLAQNVPSRVPSTVLVLLNIYSFTMMSRHLRRVKTSKSPALSLTMVINISRVLLKDTKVKGNSLWLQKERGASTMS